MNLITSFKTAVKILRTNRRRTFLTVLGIIIGVAAVIIIMSVGAGAQSLIFDQFSSFGSNLISVMPGFSDEKGPPASVMGIVVTTLKQSDAEELKKIKEIESVASYVRGIDTITWQNREVDATFVGTNVDYVAVESVKIERGNFFDESDEKSLARVAVLGYQVAEDLFGNQNPVGEEIKIKRERFRVIGVVAKRGVEAFQNQDNLVFVPLLTAQKILLGIDHVNMIRARVFNDSDVPVAIEQIEQILRANHDIFSQDEDDFSVRAAIQALDALKQVTDALTLFLAAIAAISLLVGGVGIMNIMLASVTERTKEIGLRKAIGATANGIQNQFLTEAVVITVVGGATGIAFGFLFSGLIALVANYLGYNWQFVITLSSVLLGLGVSSLVGIIFGWYPARRAARLEPVEALRYE
ncbi:MAG TPA: ABC transporter permease [bacterium]|nr:ABC transporter permease [bacterium]HPL95176.1 ABC transporter permease [bacterium]